MGVQTLLAGTCGARTTTPSDARALGRGEAQGTPRGRPIERSIDGAASTVDYDDEAVPKEDCPRANTRGSGQRAEHGAGGLDRRGAAAEVGGPGRARLRCERLGDRR